MTKRDDDDAGCLHCALVAYADAQFRSALRILQGRLKQLRRTRPVPTPQPDAAGDLRYPALADCLAETNANLWDLVRAASLVGTALEAAFDLLTDLKMPRGDGETRH